MCYLPECLPDEHEPFEALRDEVIVRIIYAENIQSIIIPDSAKQYSGDFCGEVVAIGPDHLHGLTPGDRIYFRRHEGWPITYRGEKLVVLRDKWVEAVEVKS